MLGIVWIKNLDCLRALFRACFYLLHKGLFGADFMVNLRGYLRGRLGLFCGHIICHDWP